jgi:undecaprenyl-diphosphatase
VTLLQAVVLGLVQGLTEFLPISSTAHLRLVPALFGWHFDYNHAHPNDPGAPFTAVIQLGTTLAIIVYFWRELLQVGLAWVRGLYDRSMRSTLEHRMGWYLIVATVPVAVFGYLFSDQIETGARNLWVISCALIALALVLFAAERIGRRNRDEEELTAADAIAVGTAQALALIPGASRSGVTITAGLFRGLTRETAARFSFLLSIPAVVLSGLYELRKIGDADGPGAGLTGVAVVISFLVGLASIVFYRVALGTLLIVLLSTGVLDATR